MYAVIRSGGKQERVEQGQTLAVELLGASAGDEIEFQPILLVDGDTVLARHDELGGASVSARVVG
ncbi:MAG: large ribosomal subunit protein bL21, partial [Acidimicrobiales bacterium]